MKKIYLLLALIILNYTAANANTKVHFAVPGPRNISYLPIELISKLGADRDQGIRLNLIYTSSGSLALTQLINRNAQFAVAGFPAQMSLYASGRRIFTIAAVNNAPLFVLMVRQELSDQIKTVADLRSRIIGVNTSSHLSKTTSRQLMELLLYNAGVSLDSVHFVSAGQSWREQSSIITSSVVDAVMGDEPFASRLRDMGKVFFLVNLAHLQNENIPGTNFLHAALATRHDLINHAPQLIEKVVRALKTTLQWINTHSPEQIVEKLAISDAEERNSLLSVLRIYPNLYSPDGRFSNRQLRDTEYFFTTANKNPKVKIDLRTQIIDRWVGRRD